MPQRILGQDEADPAAQASSGATYWAFLSYSHHDAALATWLHRSLETWPVPGTLVGRPIEGTRVPRRLFPIFRDREEFPSAPDLGFAIRTALDRSRTLIVLCSPAAAASQWVQAEIDHFRAGGRGHRILAVLLSGEPRALDPAQECLPSGLRGAVEPLAADLRPGGDGRRLTLLKLAAGLLDLGLDELRQRDRVRRGRRRALMAMGGLGAAAMGGFGWLALADAGLEPPYGEAIRRGLDAEGASYFRPVPPPAEVAAGLDLLRFSLRDRMVALTSPEGRLRSGKMSLWEVSQIASALYLDPGVAPEYFEGLAPALEQRIGPGLAEVADELAGHRTESRPPTAEPVLWCVIALAAGLVRADALSEGERGLFRRRLADAQRAADAFHPGPARGWNLLARQTDSQAHSTYVTALALHALAAVREAGLDWGGAPARASEIARENIGWLIDVFLRDEGEGWRRSEDDDKQPDPNLTLFVLSALGRWIDTAGVLPSPVWQCARRSLAGLTRRERDAGGLYEDMTERPAYRDAQGAEAGTPFVRRMLWYPWSICALAQWTRRTPSAPGMSGADGVALRRAQAHLALVVGPTARKQLLAPRALDWVQAEVMVGLSLRP